MTTSDAQAVEFVTKVPRELAAAKGALSGALFYLAIGTTTAPEPPPATRAVCKSVRFRLDGRAVLYLDTLTKRYGSRRSAVLRALSWAASQDDARVSMLENTLL